jgi:hypothetical protein
LWRRLSSGKLFEDFRSALLEREDGIVFWWGILAFAAAAVAALFGPFHWILTDPATEPTLATEQFQVQQEYRALRRSGKVPSR